MTVSHLILTTLCSLMPIFQKGKPRLRMTTKSVKAVAGICPGLPHSDAHALDHLVFAE